MRLFPQLLQQDARELAASLATMSFAELVERSALQFDGTILDATGGQEVNASEMTELRDRLRRAASNHGFDYNDPNTTPALSKTERVGLDSALARTLYGAGLLTPNQAARSGVWSFIGCVLAPELVRWRFFGGDKGTSQMRFRGNRLRNMFGRLWWRAFLFYDASHTDPYWLVEALGEDELVQITERPNAAGFPDLTRALGSYLVRMWKPHHGVARSHVLREAMKRLLRWMTMIRFELLAPEELDLAVIDLFLVTFEGMGVEIARAELRELGVPGLFGQWHDKRWQDVALHRRYRWVEGLSDEAIAALDRFRNEALPSWGESEPRWRLLHQADAPLSEIIGCGGPSNNADHIPDDDVDTAGEWLAEADSGSWVREVEPERGMHFILHLSPQDIGAIRDAVSHHALDASVSPWDWRRCLNRSFGGDWQEMIGCLSGESCRRIALELNLDVESNDPAQALAGWLVPSSRKEPQSTTEAASDPTTNESKTSDSTPKNTNNTALKGEASQPSHSKPDKASTQTKPNATQTDTDQAEQSAQTKPRAHTQKNKAPTSAALVGLPPAPEGLQSILEAVGSATVGDLDRIEELLHNTRGATAQKELGAWINAIRSVVRGGVEAKTHVPIDGYPSSVGFVVRALKIKDLRDLLKVDMAEVPKMSRVGPKTTKVFAQWHGACCRFFDQVRAIHQAKGG